MSKIGKKPLAIPSGVTIDLSGSTLTVKGPKGTLTRQVPVGLTITVADGSATVKPQQDDPSRAERAQWGLWRALVGNMIQINHIH